jgi:hypothetical protein
MSINDERRLGMKIAVLDDYQEVALKMADWSTIPDCPENPAYNPVIGRI